MGADDKARNKLDELTGKAKEHVGDASGDEQLEAEGRLERGKASLKQAGEKVKDAVRD